MRPPAGRCAPAIALQQRRLAGAVGADQRQRLAALDAEADVAHRLQQAVPDVEPLDGEHAHFGPPPR